MTDTLFDILEPPRKKTPNVTAAPKWVVNNTRATCHDCVTEIADGKFITALRAQWKRTEGETVALYCYHHAIPRRDADNTTQHAA